MSGDRDSKGRFKKGNGASRNAGRPPKAREERYHEILITACTFADWGRIVKKAVEQAKRGNAQARQWLAGYLVGPPQQKVDITTDGAPIVFSVSGIDLDKDV